MITNSARCRLLSGGWPSGRWSGETGVSAGVGRFASFGNLEHHLLTGSLQDELPGGPEPRHSSSRPMTRRRRAKVSLTASTIAAGDDTTMSVVTRMTWMARRTCVLDAGGLLSLIVCDLH